MTARYVPALDRALIEQATRQTHAFWGEGRPLARHTAHNFAQLERAGPGLLRYVGLVDRGRLVASIKRYSMLLRRGDGVVRGVGIGAVFTPERFRGRGLASELIREVLAEARDLGYAAAYLYSDIGPEMYERLGFVRLKAFDAWIGVDELPRSGALATRPATDDDTRALIEFHDASWSASPRAIHEARTPAIWRYFRWRNLIRGEHVLRVRGRDVGYVMVAPDEPMRDLPGPRPPTTLWLDEWSAPGVPVDRVMATVRAIARRHGCTRVLTWPRPGDAPASWTTTRRTEAWGMIAALDESMKIQARRDFLSPFGHF